MKFRLVLVVLFFLPFYAFAQQGKDQNVKLYVKGPMYVSYKASETKKGEAESTTLFVGGSMKVGNDASIVQKGRTEITEHFYNALDPVAPNKGAYNVFKNLVDKEDDGVIAFVGKVGDKLNGNYRMAVQRIQRSADIEPTTLTPDMYNLQKKTNYITFPTIRVEKKPRTGEPAIPSDMDWMQNGFLYIDTTAAVSIDYLMVIPENRLVLEASYDANITKGKQPQLNSSQVFLRRLHPLMNQRSTPDAIAPADVYSQLNMQLYDRLVDENSKTYPNTLRKNENEVYLTGLTSPFRKLGADYMFYQVLSKPDKTSVHSNKGPILNPYEQMEAGLGYFTAMELTKNDHSHINDTWQSHRPVKDHARARGGYIFSRKMFEDHITQKPHGMNPSEGGVKMENFSRFTYKKNLENVSSSNYRDHLLLTRDEQFNVGDVTVKLQQGINFLGNPFMAPISLNVLLGWPHKYPLLDYAGVANDQTAKDGFDVPLIVNKATSLPVKASTQEADEAKVDLRAKYWVINNATVEYTHNVYLYKVTYDFISRDGATSGTVTGINNDGTHITNGTAWATKPQDYLIAPMQMFLLQSNKDMEVVLKPELQTFGAVSFKRSSSNVIHRDWFTVEMEDLSDGVKDRTSVIFREDARPDNSNDPYDTHKVINKDYEDELFNQNGYTRSLKNVASPVSAIYTQSSDGVKLLGNGVPANIKELALYTTSPESQRLMRLNFYGLDNLESVPGVWLIDRYNKTTVKVDPGTVYEYTAGPSDLKEFADGNRFILRFYEGNDVIDNSDEKAYITCYYNNLTLNISNLTEDDLGSTVQIYDIQGRLMGNTKVDEWPSMTYLKPLNIGTYIVKISGKRNLTTKFINLHN